MQPRQPLLALTLALSLVFGLPAAEATPPAMPAWEQAVRQNLPADLTPTTLLRTSGREWKGNQISDLEREFLTDSTGPSFSEVHRVVVPQPFAQQWGATVNSVPIGEESRAYRRAGESLSPTTIL